MAMGSYLSIITLNVNGLNAPTKRQRLAEWIQKQDPYICCLQETHLKTGDTYRLKVKGWKKIFHANRDQKKAGVAILISDKIDFKTKAVKRDKEGHYIMIKGSIQEEDITIINIYAPNIGAPQYVRQILTSMKGEINNNTIIRSDQIRSVAQSCPTLCDPMNRSTPGLPVHHQLPEFTQTHVHRVSDAIQPSHPLSSPSPPAPNPSQHQSLFQ